MELGAQHTLARMAWLIIVELPSLCFQECHVSTQNLIGIGYQNNLIHFVRGWPAVYNRDYHYQEGQCAPPNTTRGAEQAALTGIPMESPAPENHQMKWMLHNQHM
eukprot:25301-Ditylum_brightwellii.AAC.1